MRRARTRRCHFLETDRRWTHGLVQRSETIIVRMIKLWLEGAQQDVDCIGETEFEWQESYLW